MSTKNFDVVVIGGGPAGYNCAIRASQLSFKGKSENLRVACVEKDKLGGTCLNVGCIPSKALLESSAKYDLLKSGAIAEFGIEVGDVTFNHQKIMQSKDKIVAELNGGISMLLKANNIKHIVGSAKFIDSNTIEVNGEKITAENFVIATGSFPLNLKDVAFDEKVILSNVGALSLDSVPKTMVIVGAGVIGLELGSVWSRYGSQVTVLEYLNIVAPTMDADISNGLLKSLKKQGLNFEFGVSVTKIENKEDHAIIHYLNNETKETKSMQCDKVLVSIGRGAYSEALGLDKIGIKLDEKKRIIVDHQNLQTNIKNIYAVGDVIVGPMLAHKAEEEGVWAAEIIAGQKPIMSHEFIPSVIYTHPEAASIGATEEELKKAGIEYTIGKATFAANGRAKTLRDTEGFVKLICDKDKNKILGAHILHSAAGTLINEMAAYLAFSPCAPDDIVLTCHSHPDLNETIKAAALDILDRPLSALPKKKK